MNAPIIFPGASYIDYWPNGERVIVYEGAFLDTHLGRVDFPPGEDWIMFARCVPPIGIEPFKICGKGHKSGWLWEWRADTRTWDKMAANAFRPIYDKKSVLRDEGPVGFEFITESGLPVSRFVTNPPRNGVSDWTEVQSTLIGGGHDLPDPSGLVFWDGALKMIHPGFCTFDNVHPEGQRVVVSWRMADGAYKLDTTLSTLKALPIISTPIFTPFTHLVTIAPFNAEGSGALDALSLQSDGRRIEINDSPASWVPPSSLRSFDLPMIEFYRLPQESLRESEKRWGVNLDTLLAGWAGDIGVIPMFYTQNRWTIEEVIAGLKSLPSLVNRSDRIKVVAPFAYNRLNGIVSSPLLLDAFNQLRSATPGPATLLPPNTMIKPEVTVNTFAFSPTNNLADGEYLQFFDRSNPQGAKVRVWVEGGSMRMSIEYPGVGVGQTGAKRPVR